MFFGNKNLEEKVLLLEREIEDLKNQLLLKAQEKEEIQKDFSKELELFTISLTRIISKINNLSFSASVKVVKHVMGYNPLVSFFVFKLSLGG